MAFFDFLKDANSEKKAAKKFFSFLSDDSDPLKNVKDPRIRRAIENDPRGKEVLKKYKEATNPFNALKSTKDLVVSVARAPIREGISLGASLNQAQGSGVDTVEMNNPILKAVLGKDPIQT